MKPKILRHLLHASNIIHDLVILAFVIFSSIVLYSQESELQQTKTLTSVQTKTCVAPYSPLTSPCALQLIDAARSTSPELHTLTLLLIIESKNQLTQRQKLALAREAFDTATTASFSIKKQRAIAVLKTDTDIGFSSSAFDKNLDRLSLQARSLRDIDKISPSLAQQLIPELKIPDLPPLECTDALAYDPSAYYDLLKRAAQIKSAKQDRTKDTVVDLLAPALNLKTHTQLPHAFTLLSEVTLTDAQLQDLTQILIGQLTQLHADGRSFEAVVTDPSFIRSAEKLYQALESHERYSGASFLRSYRQYLVDNYRSGGCGTLWLKTITTPTDQGLHISFKDLRSPAANEKRVLPNPIQSFNAAFSAPLRQIGLEPIAISEIDANTPVTTAIIHDFWIDSTSSTLLKEEQLLRFNPDGSPRTQSELASSAAQSKAIGYLEQIDQWSADPFSSQQVFEEKVMLYMGVLGLSPAEETRQNIIEKLLSLFENSTLEKDNPALWLILVSRYQSGIVPQIDGEKPAQRTDPLQLFVNSSNPSLHLIGLLERMQINPFADPPK